MENERLNAVPYKVDPSNESLSTQLFDNFSSPLKKGLTLDNFSTLLKCLFNDGIRNGEKCFLEDRIANVFTRFDTNKDEVIDKYEFESMWNKWLKNNLWPKSALIIVDVQNDFISGSLAINRCPAKQKGEDVIPVINKLIKQVPFHLIVYTQDWHPLDHISFLENAFKRNIVAIEGEPVVSDTKLQIDVFSKVTFNLPPLREQKLWPTHCVQNTWGSELHSELIIAPSSVRILKGVDSLIDSYSAFLDNCASKKSNLYSKLKEANINRVYLCGIAYDVCVAFTAYDAIKLGLGTVIVDDACRGVDTEDIDAIKCNLVKGQHCVIVDSERVYDMVCYKDRSLELLLALNSTY